MKLFIYKTLFVSLIFFIIFHLTFGFLVKNIERKIFNNFTSKKINILKEKTRAELKKSLKKDRILNEEDARILNQIFKKLENEINLK